MKTLIKIILILYSLNSFGQQQDLTGNVWYLIELNINNTNIIIPQNSELPQVTFECSTRFRPIACNAGDAKISNINNNTIEAEDDWAYQLGSCNNTQNNNFDIMYIRTFFNDNILHPFSYTISNGNNGILIMTLTANNLDYAVYKNQQLAVSQKEKIEINLYPNPTRNSFQIEVNSDKEINSVRIFSVNGKEVLRFKEAQTSYDVSQLSKGVYFVEIEIEGGKSIKKIVKQ